MDEAQRKRVQDDLQGLLRGELLFDELSRVLYSTDASPFEIRPAGVVVPRDLDDLRALVRYASENHVPLVPRGGGTGTTGAALGGGLIVDLSVCFRQPPTLDGEMLDVEVGVSVRQLEQFLHAHGRRLPLDPDRREGTVGGLLASNPAGPRAERLGTLRDRVRQLDVVLDSGEAVTVGRLSNWPTVDATPGRLDDIVASTRTLLRQYQGVLRGTRREVPLDHCGYALGDVLEAGTLDLGRLLIGSEGTLALFTRARLHTLPLPAGRAMLLAGFARLDAALKAAQIAADSQPTACDLLDRRLLRLARGEPSLCDLVPEGAEAVLLIEVEADSPELARQRAALLATRLGQRERLALLTRLSNSADEAERFWRLTQSTLPCLSTLRGTARSLVLLDDVAVPVPRLPEYLPRLQDLLRRHETTASFRIHTLSGRVDMRPFLNLDNPRDIDRLWTLADEVYTLVLEMGGTISASRGTGLARMPWVGRQVGPLVPVLRDLKSIFDPLYIFNPGKIVAGPDLPVTWSLRRQREGGSLQPLRQPSRELTWASSSPAQESLACNGCGACRSESALERMCPIFRATRQEAATPRAKANLMRFLLEPATDPSQLPSDEVRAVADLCVNCKMCAHECPSRVNIPKLMLEAKAANVARHGLDRGEWVLARTENFAALGSALAPLTNALLTNPLARWLLDRFFGISRQRRLPRFAFRSFLREAKRRGWTHKPRSARPAVAYFVDVFANYNDPLLAQCVVEVLHHNGIEVYVPPGQVGCGMAPLAYGDVETARELAQHNLRLLSELAREGFPILCSEPSAALMLRQDAVDLLGDPDAELVAAQVVEFTAYLWDLHQQGLLKTDFQPLELSIGHHVPCHVKALGRLPMAPQLLSLIPGVRVGIIDVSCSGMAGTFGFQSDRYDLSLAAGRPMLDELRRPRYLFGSTECSACRLQMEDGALKRTLHPAQYLALAYGLVPAVESWLREPVGEWVLR